MTRPGYGDRAQLKMWADQLVSKGEFPRLVRQLILETTPGIVSLGMPAGDGVATGGWDGSVRAVDGNAWVPQGYSVWELSVDSSPGVKAESDYSKRAATPDGTAPSDTTYVEAILRTWSKRSNWAKDKSEDGVWKGVRALGLDDLETWLQAAPITWAWLSEEFFHLSPHGLRTGLTWWKTWSSQTSPVITPALVLAGRDSQSAELVSKVKPGVLSITGASVKDVCAFIAATAIAQDESGDGSMLARLAFVDDRATWRRLLETKSPLVLVALDPQFAAEVSSDTIHTVLMPLASSPVGGDVELPDLDSAQVAKALEAAQPDLADIEELSRLASRSLTALRRRIARKPELEQPIWATTPIGREVRAALMLGSWNDRSAGDRAIAEQLAGVPYEAFKSACDELSRGEDPFLTKVGEQWHLVSPVDAWMLLGGHLTEEDLQRLKPAVDEVLGEVDPALDLPADSRWWRAAVEGKQRKHSSFLGLGLGESLAYLGVYGGAARVETISGSEWSAYLVRELLDAANADSTGHGWQSMAPMLSLLVEAAPEVTARAISVALANEQSLMRTLFIDERSDPFSATSPHVHLLWALERLAWSDELFGQAIDLLAKLDQLDPGGRSSNRPAESLSNIFCPWHPENTVSVDRRLKALDALRRRYPSTAEPLLRSLLPEFHGTHFPTSSPEFRDWKPAEVRVTHAEYHDFVIEVLTRLMADAEARADAWIALLDTYSNLPPDGRVLFRTELGNRVESGAFDIDDRRVVWRKMIDLAGDHRNYPDAQWALPEDELIELDKIAADLAPAGAVDKHANLFDDWNPHLGEVSRRDDFDAYDKALNERRAEAATEMAADGDLESILALAKRVKIPGALGYALATTGGQHDDAMFALLHEKDYPTRTFTSAYFQRRFYDSGWEWAENFLAEHADSEALRRGLFLASTRDFPRSWEVAAGTQDVANVYWKNFGINGLGGDFEHVETVARCLIDVGRLADGLQFLGIYGRRDAIDDKLQAEMTAEILEKLLHAQDQIEAGNLRDYDFEEAFKCMEAQVEHLGLQRVAGLEWAYLGALGFEPSVPALSKALAEDPGFFAEMICLIYKSPNEPETERTPAERAQRGRTAANAYSLLKAWDQPPGLIEGTMDAAALSEWTAAMKDHLNDSGRAKHGLIHLGDILATAPPDTDGTTPGQVVRDLLEDLQSDDVEEGLYLAIVNERGVTTRSLDEGGTQERDLVATFKANAAKIADDSPRAAALMRRVAASYERDARRNDESAEKFKKGLDR